MDTNAWKLTEIKQSRNGKNWSDQGVLLRGDQVEGLSVNHSIHNNDSTFSHDRHGKIPKYIFQDSLHYQPMTMTFLYHIKH